MGCSKLDPVHADSASVAMFRYCISSVLFPVAAQFALIQSHTHTSTSTSGETVAACCCPLLVKNGTTHPHRAVQPYDFQILLWVNLAHEY